MTRVISVANQKGGVVKTTSTVNIAAALAESGARVLVVDLDPQGNASTALGVDHREGVPGVYEVVTGEAPVSAVIQVCPDIANLLVAPATIDLAGAEIELVSQVAREYRLSRAIDAFVAEQAAQGTPLQFVLIDCPPSLSMLTLNGLCSAHGVIVPMQCEYFALEGLTDLVNTIKQVHANLNADLQVIGLLRVMFDPRITLQQQVSEQLKDHFGDKVFNSVIPRNVRLAEAPSYGLPGVVFDPAAKGSQAFVEFAQEMVERVQSMPAAASSMAKMASSA